MLHGVRVMRRRRALIKTLTLFDRQRVAGSNALDTAKNFHYSALNPSGGWAWVFVIEQQTHCRATHVDTDRGLGTASGRYLFGQEPYEQRGFSSPVC